jgi:Male sterility protein
MDEARMAPVFDDNFITSCDMVEDVDTNSPIKDYLRDKTIFLTGGFGFLGKLLIEKLLRCDVKKIYLLVRAKRGKSLEERFEKLIAEPVSASRSTLSRC